MEQLFHECNGFAGAFFDGMSEFLAIASVGFALIAGFTSRVRPKGIQMFVAGFSWLAAGVLFACMFYSVMSAAIELAATNSTLDSRCLEARRDLTTAVLIPVVLLVGGGIGVAFLAARLSTENERNYRLNMEYVGLGDAGELCWLKYCGRTQWSGEAEWMYLREGEPAHVAYTRYLHGQRTLPQDIAVVRSFAEIELMQQLQAPSMLNRRLADLGFKSTSKRASVKARPRVRPPGRSRRGQYE